MCACNGRLPPQPSPAPLPEWITRPITPIKAATSEQARALLGQGGTSSSGASSSSSQPAMPTGSASVESLRHPDPSNSLDELRWRDYQTLRAGGIPPALLIPTPTQPAAAQPATAIPAAAGLLPPGQIALPGFPLPGVATPNTPQFPTPVRTLFPPTPPPAAAAAGEDCMDTSGGEDLASLFHSIYARPENAVASPEEMRVVQIESYKAGRQIAPYWLVGGASAR